MIALGGDVKVVVATQPVDFRRGINGLVALVASALAADPYCGDVFVFRPKRGDRLRLLFWDGSGMVLASKWLESGRFSWPPIRRPGPADARGVRPSGGRPRLDEGGEETRQKTGQSGVK